MNGQNANLAISIGWSPLSAPVSFRRRNLVTWVLLLGLTCLTTPNLPAADEHAGHRHGASGTSGRSLSNNKVTWPTREEFIETITLKQYNTRVVFLGTLMLGICAAMVGTFMLLRKRALMGDVVGHATLPGIGVAFIVMELIKPDSGKWLPGLLIGAFIAGLCGIAATTLIRRYSRVKEDTAMAIVLSIFFGLGVVLFSIVQNIPSGSVAGLKHFIFGKTLLGAGTPRRNFLCNVVLFNWSLAFAQVP